MSKMSKTSVSFHAKVKKNIKRPNLANKKGKISPIRLQKSKLTKIAKKSPKFFSLLTSLLIFSNLEALIRRISITFLTGYVKKGTILNLICESSKESFLFFLRSLMFSLLFFFE